MKNSLLKNFFLVSVLMMPRFGFAAEKAGRIEGFEAKLGDALTKSVQEVKVDKRVYFDPSVAEIILAKAFEGYNLDEARQLYDELSTAGQGKVSVPDLMRVCEVGFKGTYAPRQARRECQKYGGFIHDLITNATQVDKIYDEMPLGDYTKFDSKCTAPAVSTTRAQSLYCLSGKHKDDPAFEKAMMTTFRLEGDCADVGDGAGMTCFGVSSDNNPEMLSNTTFNRADAEDIAFEKYYRTPKIYLLPDEIRGDVFYMNWWSNGKEAIRSLQHVVGLKDKDADGLIGPTTAAVVKNYTGLDLRRQYIAQLWLRQKNTSNFGKFGNGWANALEVFLDNGCHTPMESKPVFEANAKTLSPCEKTAADYLGKDKVQQIFENYKKTKSQN